MKPKSAAAHAKAGLPVMHGSSHADENGHRDQQVQRAENGEENERANDVDSALGCALCRTERAVGLKCAISTI